MRFLLIIFGLVFLMINGYGQGKISTVDHTLTVKGVAILKQTPDIIYATINIKIESKEYNDCQDKVITALQKAHSYFINNDISKDLIRTNEIGVSEDREYKNGEYVGKGFIGNISLTIESDYTIEFTQKLLAAFKNDSLSVYYNIGFKLSEKLKAELRQKAVAMAIADANEKARTIAETSNIQLIKINSIVYKDDDYPSRNINKYNIK